MVRLERIQKRTSKGIGRQSIVQITTGVCDKNTPPENDTHWNISFQSTKSGAGL